MRRLGREQWVHEETEQPQAVLHRHHDHAVARQGRRQIPGRLLGTAEDLPSAVNEHHHRLRRTGGWIDPVDVQGEAVFVPERRAAAVGLRAAVAKRRCVAHSLPLRGKRGRTPAQSAHGRCGKGNAAEGAKIPLNRTLHLTRLGTDHGRGAHTARGWRGAALIRATATATTGQGNQHQHSPWVFYGEPLQESEPRVIDARLLPISPNGHGHLQPAGNGAR